MADEPVTATIPVIAAVFGIPAGRVRAIIADLRLRPAGHEPGLNGHRRATYNVRAVVAERDRRNDTAAGASRP